MTTVKTERQRAASIAKTIETACQTARCPVCGEHPSDCICYGQFGKSSQRALPQIETWQPWKMKDLIKP